MSEGGFKPFSGYYGCERCTQKGVWLGRVTYQAVEDLEACTDKSFRQNSQQEHHQQVSLFIELDIDMVKAFPGDYMQSGLSGCHKEVDSDLDAWKEGNKNV